MPVIIRRAVPEDLDEAARIYQAIFDHQAGGPDYTNWLPGVYPTRAVAARALELGTLYAAEVEGAVSAVAVLNHSQLPEYDRLAWQFPGQGEQVLVIHTLCVDPARAGQGVATAFVRFAEDLGRARGCTALRLDTYEGNLPARRLYTALGYRLAGATECLFLDGRRKMLVGFEKDPR